MPIEHLNPDKLHSSPAYSQCVSASAIDRLIFVGGQNGVDAAGEPAGNGLRAQTRQALHNVLIALEAAGASRADVVRLTVHIVQGHEPAEAFKAAQEVWGPHPTTVTVLLVAGLANPVFLVEIEATAVITRALTR